MGIHFQNFKCAQGILDSQAEVTKRSVEKKKIADFVSTMHFEVAQKRRKEVMKSKWRSPDKINCIFFEKVFFFFIFQKLKIDLGFCYWVLFFVSIFFLR